MNEAVIEFTVFCIENVAEELGITGTEAFNALDSSGILDSYIIPSYDVLHTQGRKYVVSDIIGVMKDKGLAV